MQMSDIISGKNEKCFIVSCIFPLFNAGRKQTAEEERSKFEEYENVELELEF